MYPQIETILATLSALSRRERLLLLIRAVGQGLAVFAGMVFVGVLFVLVGAPMSVVGRGTLWVAVVTGILFMLWPLAWRWKDAGSAAYQAKKVEEMLPALRQRLVTIVGVSSHPNAWTATSSRNPMLLLRSAQSVAESVGALSPNLVHPSHTSLRWVSVALVLVVANGLGELLLPLGPLDILSRAASGDSRSPMVIPASAEAVEERVEVGNIVLRYQFPEYTGLGEVEVTNSDGTIHAPSGTLVQISARTAEAFESCALQVNGAPPAPVRLVNGRDVFAEVLVAEPGVWRLVFGRSEEVRLGPDFVIEVESDSPPIVALEREPPPSVPVDQPLGVSWSVHDDFGIDRVVLEVTENGTTREFELRRPLDNPRELGGSIRMTPRDLGLQAGATAEMRVVAYDNDVAGGTKRGETQPFTVKAIGAQGQGRMMVARIEELRDAMIPILAGFLTDSIPIPGGEVGVNRWAETARSRYDGVRELSSTGVGPPDSIEADLVKNVLESGGRVIRFAITTWEPGSARRITEGDQLRFADLHGEATVALEKAIFVLDNMLVSWALGEVARVAEDLSAEAQDLAARASDMEAQEILARLDKLQRMFADLAKKAERVNEGALQEYLNPRMDEASNLMEQVRKAVSEGRLDDAREMLAQLAEQIQQMSEGIGDRMAASQSGEDQLGDAAKKALSELETLAQDQSDLANELQKKREELGDSFSEQMELWKRLDELAVTAEASGRDAVESVGDGKGWRLESVRSLEVLSERTAGIADAVRARDLESSSERLRDSLRPLDVAQRATKMERTRDRMGQATPVGVGPAIGHVESAKAAIVEMLDILDELLRRQDSEDPRMQEAAKEMSARQQELRDRQSRLQKDVQKVERALPTGDGTATDAMQRAGEAMERATNSLGEGDALNGEGHQREATERIGEARDLLEKQLQQMQQMQQGRSQMQGQKSGQSDEGGDEQSGQQDQDPFSIEIPAPEDFQTPEAYRRALLEGMAGDVPDEYRALKQLYFEELVHQ